MSHRERKQVLLLCGGVGGAKLAHGFEQLAGELDAQLLVNVGDDFEHLGLQISPDLDTVLYTLAGLADRQRGWGIAGESWRTLERLGTLGGETWFQLGDLDLATHLFRTAALDRGETLTQITAALASSLDIESVVLPATEQRLRTRVNTDQGVLDFQEYFVRERCRPRVTQIEFEGAGQARPSPALEQRVRDTATAFDAVILAPSNPFLSIDPILAIDGMVPLLRQASQHIMAVSPIVSGKAIKGPAAKLMGELALPVSAAGWALYLTERYPDLVDEWILDRADAESARELQAAGLRVRTIDTIMRDDRQRRRLAVELLEELP